MVERRQVHLRRRKILERRQGPLEQLRAIRLPVHRTSEGTIEGQLSIDPSRFESLPGIELERLHPFRVVDAERLVFVMPSPFAALGPVSFGRASRANALSLMVEQTWRGLVAQTRPCLELAQALAPNARVLGNPWRIEGSLRIQYEDVRLLFSRRGDRACICALNGRPIVGLLDGPRMTIPVPLRRREEEASVLWGQAIEQAKRGIEAESMDDGDEADAHHISLDLAEKALLGAEFDERERSLDLSSSDLPG